MAEKSFPTRLTEQLRWVLRVTSMSGTRPEQRRSIPAFVTRTGSTVRAARRQTNDFRKTSPDRSRKPFYDNRPRRQFPVKIAAVSIRFSLARTQQEYDGKRYLAGRIRRRLGLRDYGRPSRRCHFKRAKRTRSGVIENRLRVPRGVLYSE